MTPVQQAADNDFVVEINDQESYQTVLNAIAPVPVVVVLKKQESGAPDGSLDECGLKTKKTSSVIVVSSSARLHKLKVDLEKILPRTRPISTISAGSRSVCCTRQVNRMTQKNDMILHVG